LCRIEWELPQVKLTKHVDNSGVTKKKGVERRIFCVGVTHSKNTTLGDLNTINSNKLHYQGYKLGDTKNSISNTKLA